MSPAPTENEDPSVDESRSRPPSLSAPTLISPAIAGEVNRARVLQALYDVGPLSRADLARLTGCTRATIGSIVQPMIDRNLLAEGVRQPSSSAGGKPARPLWFSPQSQPIAALHLLPGQIDAALVQAGGTIMETTSRGFDPQTRHPECVINAAVDCVEQIRQAGAPRPLGVGIAVGGMVDTDQGTIVQINLAPGLAGLPLGPLVAERTGLPTYLELHSRVQALGDRWFGQGRGLSNFASIYAGDALGVGLVLGGTVYRGSAGAGGEIGHTVVQAGGLECGCGQRGCWETIASHRWLRGEAVRLGLPSAPTMTTGRLARMVARGDKRASDLFDQYARNLAIGVANLQQIIAPGLFILHGEVVAGEEPLRSRIERNVREAVLHHPGGKPTIAFASLDDRATLLGAAGLVLSHSLQLNA
ncbi:MAG TPA: ROK family transcriptional regulator [Streptosporangiaceae bacterium]|nr:ROK family transcriptional regulator [Streptosporangiaceae bacterium]